MLPQSAGHSRTPSQQLLQLDSVSRGQLMLPAGSKRALWTAPASDAQQAEAAGGMGRWGLPAGASAPHTCAAAQPIANLAVVAGKGASRRIAATSLRPGLSACLASYPLSEPAPVLAAERARTLALRP
jgi:hypothetical protein